MRHIFLLLFFCTSSFAASLDFSNADTDHVDHGSDASLDRLSNVSICLWINPNDVTNAFYGYAAKLIPATGQSASRINRLAANGQGFNIGQDASGANSLSSSISVLTANSWHFICGTSSFSAQTIGTFHGTIDKNIIDVETTEELGTGTVVDDSAANMHLGHWNETGFTRSFDGLIGFFLEMDKEMTLGELRETQFNPQFFDGTVLMSYTGLGGTDTQYDFSSYGNHGTVSGAAYNSDGPPIHLGGSGQ